MAARLYIKARLRPFHRAAASLGWLAAVLLAGHAHADPVSCPDSLMSVDAADAALSQSICEIALEVGDRLEKCGLIQTHPLTIEVVRDLSHPMGTCLASFDCHYELIRITDWKRYDSLLEPDVPYSLLPPLVTMRAFLTHEMAHALLHQSAGKREIAIVDDEYVAGAMELELMEPRWRDVMVAASPVSLPPKIGLIDIWIYYMEPRKFAVNAWQHFSQSENGCDLIRQIVAGEMTFEQASR